MTTYTAIPTLLKLTVIRACYRSYQTRSGALSCGIWRTGTHENSASSPLFCQRERQFIHEAREYVVCVLTPLERVDMPR